MSNEERILIPSDVNLASFRNIKEINEGSEARRSELIATLSCMLVGMVRVQSFTRSRRPWTRKSLFGKGIGGLLVLYLPILERGGAEV